MILDIPGDLTGDLTGCESRTPAPAPRPALPPPLAATEGRRYQRSKARANVQRLATRESCAHARAAARPRHLPRSGEVRGVRSERERRGKAHPCPPVGWMYVRCMWGRAGALALQYWAPGPDGQAGRLSVFLCVGARYLPSVSSWAAALRHSAMCQRPRARVRLACLHVKFAGGSK